MEQSPDDRVCVINIDVNCCIACSKELKKVLSQVEGVFDVMYDPTTKLATITGRFDPFVLMNTINKMGKKAELISYNRHRPIHEETHTAPDQQNAAAPNPYKDKGKNKVGQKKMNRDSSCHDYSDDDLDEAEELVSRKSDKYHKPEAYVPPKGVDEAICRDRFCRIHKRHGSIHDRVAKEAREKASSMFWQIPHLYQELYGREASYPHYRPSMFPPGYGYYPPTLLMSGLNDPTSYLNNENPSKCNTM